MHFQVRKYQREQFAFLLNISTLETFMRTGGYSFSFSVCAAMEYPSSWSLLDTRDRIIAFMVTPLHDFRLNDKA